MDTDRGERDYRPLRTPPTPASIDLTRTNELLAEIRIYLLIVIFLLSIIAASVLW